MSRRIPLALTILAHANTGASALYPWNLASTRP